MIKLAIVGGGASGLSAAITAQELGCKVTLFEAQSSVGKKILASGNGRCNITNTNPLCSNYHSSNPNFIQTTLDHINFATIESFFTSMGLLLDSKEDGRVYPLSNEAKSVVQVLVEKAQNCGVIVKTNTKILGITKAKDFTLRSENQNYKGFTHLLIASGLQAAPQLGSCTDGLGFAQSFGHTILPQFASLVQLQCKEHMVTNKMAGVRFKGVVNLYVDSKKVSHQEGDILFTKYGLSGLAILDSSYLTSKALLNGSKVEVRLNLSMFEKDRLIKTLQTLQKQRSGTVEEMLTSLVSLKVAKQIAIELHIKEKKVQTISAKDIQAIANKMLDWRFTITETHGFKHAEVAGGGVDTAQVNAETFESTVCKNLYFSGEVLDIVGDRGGYNFHFAWASGMMAAKAIAKHPLS